MPCSVPCSTNARINPHQSRRAALNARRSCGSCAERHGLTACRSYLRLSAWPAEYFISRSDDAHGSHYNVASSRGHNGRRGTGVAAGIKQSVSGSRRRENAIRCGEMQQAPTHIKHCAELYDNPVHSVFLRHPQPYSGQDLRTRHNRGVWRSAFVFFDSSSENRVFSSLEQRPKTPVAVSRSKPNCGHFRLAVK